MHMHHGLTQPCLAMGQCMGPASWDSSNRAHQPASFGQGKQGVFGVCVGELSIPAPEPAGSPHPWEVG